MKRKSSKSGKNLLKEELFVIQATGDNARLINSTPFKAKAFS